VKNLPPLPWDWTCADRPTANGTFQVYIADANGRKIAAIWGKPEERETIADTIISLVNASSPAATNREESK
jgi:hypothetical protein